MEEKKIEVMITWLESQSFKNIQVFLGFANFDKRFIKDFNRIVTSLILML